MSKTKKEKTPPIKKKRGRPPKNKQVDKTMKVYDEYCTCVGSIILDELNEIVEHQSIPKSKRCGISEEALFLE